MLFSLVNYLFIDQHSAPKSITNNVILFIFRKLRTLITPTFHIYTTKWPILLVSSNISRHKSVIKHKNHKFILNTFSKQKVKQVTNNYLGSLFTILLFFFFKRACAYVPFMSVMYFSSTSKKSKDAFIRDIIRR